MGRTTYCLPVDVLRKFDPKVVEADLADGTDLFYGDSKSGASIDGEDRIYSRIEEVENMWDQRTRNPQRLTHVGGATGVYEFHSADLYRYQGGVKVYLDHRGIEPVDSSEGDTVEVRTGIDSWRDITSREGSLWRMNRVKGVLHLMGFYRFSNASWRRAMLDDNIRVRYRFGGLGGGRTKPGQSDLSGTLASGETTTMSVSDASRFPRSGGIVLVDDEYVQYSSADWDNDTLDTLTRDIRGTSSGERSSGTAVHYCPMSVRSAVAAKTCVELMTYEDWVTDLIDTGNQMNIDAKVDEWETEWQNGLARFSEAKVL